MSEERNESTPLLLGVDTGGTFTDLVLFDGERLRVHKLLSTPAAPEEAILQGCGEIAPGARPAMVHGSTVATNALLEGKGVRTAYVGDVGLKDLLTLGRQARDSLYDLQPPPKVPPVPEELCLEIGGRLGADGEQLVPMLDEELFALRERLLELKPEAVAVNLLYAYLDPHWEKTIDPFIPEGVFTSLSHQVLPEYREYERGIATWLNSYVGPLVEGYLKRLRTGLDDAPLAVMQSSGGTIDAHQAGRQAVHMLLSGPAGGLQGARFVAQAAGVERLLTFDMGGTSTDVALIDGEVRLTSEGRIGGYPVGVPMVEMHTIGAGGGSIARVDAGGLLQVGPESAGAHPGPACYGRGGELPTVTDANLLLGRLRPDAFLGGRMPLDVAAARRALEHLAGPLGVTVEAAAEGVVRLADEHMARALRVISVERGIDPRGFTLLSFGGAGGLHVCALAEALGMSDALVPIHAGVLSALGMLAAPKARRRARTIGTLLADTDAEAIQAHFEELAREARPELVREGVAPDAIQVERSVDLRYQGQSYTLNLPWQGILGSAQAFHAAHAARYGHHLEAPVELVNVRVGLKGPHPPLHLEPLAPGEDAAPAAHASLHGIGECPVFRRETLPAGQEIAGPALITEEVASTYVAPGWRARSDCHGNLLLTRN